MNDSSTILLTNETDSNQIKINLNVLEVILGIAASKVDGVFEMRGTLTSSINSLFARSNRGKGVVLKVADNKLDADVYAYFNSGVNVPKVALDLQKKLQVQLKQMTDLSLNEINIHVVGLYSPKDEEQVDPDNLFTTDDSTTDSKEQLS